jgi:hypothetical protein
MQNVGALLEAIRPTLVASGEELGELAVELGRRAHDSPPDSQRQGSTRMDLECSKSARRVREIESAA